MNEDHTSVFESRAGSSGIAIVLSSITIIKAQNSYGFTRHDDRTFHAMPDCHDLWDVAENIQHRLRLTPVLLMELEAFRRKCAELHWNEAAVADHYAGLARLREEQARKQQQSPELPAAGNP